MPTSAIILTAVILAGVLLSDLGRRAITTPRLLRPLLIAAVAGASFLGGFATAGTGLVLELAGTGAGVLLGLLAAGAMHIERDPGEARAYSRAGMVYASIWIVVLAARLAFIYGTNHWFNASLGSWMHAHDVTTDALTDAVVLMALAMAIARTLSLLVRSAGPKEFDRGAAVRLGR
jgi:hypothetical protein